MSDNHVNMFNGWFSKAIPEEYKKELEAIEDKTEAALHTMYFLSMLQNFAMSYMLIHLLNWSEGKQNKAAFLMDKGLMLPNHQHMAWKYAKEQMKSAYHNLNVAEFKKAKEE